MNSQSVFNLICSFTSILSAFFMLFAFMGVFFNRNKGFHWVEVAAYGAYLIISYGSSALTRSYLVNLLTNLVVIFLITFLYEATLYRRIFATLLIIISILLIGAFGTEFLLSKWTTSLLPLKNVITCLILFGLASILKLFIKNNPDGRLPAYYCVPIAMVSLISIVITYVLLLPNLRSQKSWNALSALLLLVLNLFVFYLYEKTLERQKKILSIKLLEQQNMLYEKLFELITQSQRNIGIFRHDMRNHLTVLQSQISQNKNNEALQYMKDIFKALDSSTMLLKSDNFAIESILNGKMLEACDNGITVDCKLSVPDKLNISDFDLTAIIGNLMDNAIDAVKFLVDQTDVDQKITVKIRLDRDMLFISISNPYSQAYVKSAAITDERIHHGLGLKSVQSVLKKYDGMMNIDQNGSKFTVEIMVYNKQAQAISINRTNNDKVATELVYR